MKYKIWWWILPAAVVLCLAGYYWYKHNVIVGIVYDGPNRLAGAVVRVRGTKHHTISSEDGTFRLWLPPGRDSVRVTAWKDMYFISGMTLPRNGKLVLFHLRTFQQKDNPEYQWIRPHPDPDSDLACANCHEQIYSEWKRSTHATSSTNPKVAQLLLGTDTDGNTNVPPGRYEPNHACDGCHVPTAAIAHGEAYFTQPGDYLTPEQSDGVHCDFCHKIVAARTDHPGGNPGILRYTVMRPFENSAFPQLFVGPLDDSEGRDTYSPLYQSSLYCAPCHKWLEDNQLEIYTEYNEWEASEYARRGIDCQDCHMKPSGKMTNFAPPKPGQSRVGIERDPMTLATHDMPGVNDSTFLASAVRLDMETDIRDGAVHVTVKIANVYAGHHVPTSAPERNMVLLVEAESKGRPLRQVDGSVLPEYAGVGDDPNDYAGKPGKGYARIIRDSVTGEEPTLWWLSTAVEAEDTRIPAHTTDVTQYAFALDGTGRHIAVRATLIYRKFYKAWVDMKKWDEKDRIMARCETIMNLYQQP